MGTERDDAVEKVLAALGRAEAPEGLVARVAAGLHARAALAAREAEFGWRDLLAGSAVAGVWWRGAVVGVAASMLVVGVVMVAGHFVRGAGSGRQTAMVRGDGAVRVGNALVAREVREGPCVGVRVRSVAGVQGREVAGVEAGTPARPAPEPTLTAQELALARLARKGDLEELATLNPEVREKMAAAEAAQFQSFFAERVREPVAEPVPQPATEQVAEPAAPPVAAEAPQPVAAAKDEPVSTETTGESK